MSEFRYEVVVDTDMRVHAEQVMGERLGHDEEYEDEYGDAFDYSVDYKPMIDTADQARQQAIDWQTWVSEQSLSMLEVANWGAYFEALAERFPELADEFRENGIIGGTETETEPIKASYRVTLDGRDYFTSGVDVDEAVSTAVAMAKADGQTFSVAVTEKLKTDDALGRYTDLVTIVDIPVTFHAHYEKGEIIKFVLMPKESDAGYFGAGSHIWDGPEINLDHDGEFWTAVSRHLDEIGDEFIATWEG